MHHRTHLGDIGATIGPLNYAPRKNRLMLPVKCSNHVPLGPRVMQTAQAGWEKCISLWAPQVNEGREQLCDGPLLWDDSDEVSES